MLDINISLPVSKSASKCNAPKLNKYSFVFCTWRLILKELIVSVNQYGKAKVYFNHETTFLYRLIYFLNLGSGRRLCCTSVYRFIKVSDAWGNLNFLKSILTAWMSINIIRSTSKKTTQVPNIAFEKELRKNDSKLFWHP